MTNTKAPKRSEELARATEAAAAELSAARESLGLAIADDDAEAAQAARADVARLEQVISELAAARPIALRREREQAEAESARQRRARERASNSARRARLSQAKRVDAAMKKLGAEYEKAPGDGARRSGR